MRKQVKHKLLSFMLCMAILFTNITPLTLNNVYGETTTKDSIGSINQEDDGVNVGIDDSQYQQTTYSDEITENVSEETHVYVSQSSTFGVFIPKTIILDGDKEVTNKGEYSVSVSSYSNIGGREVISVVPEEDFELYSYGKKPIMANVSQTRKEWLHNELDKIAYGTIVANDMTAGSWSGKFYFNIGIIDYSIYDDIVVSAIDENDVNLNATSKVLVGEEKENLITDLKENEFLTKEDKLSLVIEVESDDFDTTATTTFNVSRFAKKGDTIAVYHYEESNNTWEHITTGKVDQNGYIVGDFTSFSPIAFVNKGYYSVTVAGLYSMDGQLIKTWDELIDDGTIVVENGIITKTNEDNLYDKLVLDVSITGLGNTAFKECTNLQEIILNNNITTLGDNVFYKCTSLKSINLPNSITTMGTYNFYGCTSLSKVQWPNSLITIPNYTFNNCNSLTSIGYDDTHSLVIPENLESINQNAFDNCKNLEYVDLSKNVLTVGDRAFLNCSKLQEVIFSEKTTSLGADAFSRATTLNKVTIPVSINFGYNCFDYIESITEVKLLVGTGIATNLKSNGNYNTINYHRDTPWYGQTIETIVVPEGVTSLGNYYFYGAKTSNIILPNTLNSIGNYTFGETNITSVGTVGSNANLEIPSNVTSLGDCVFKSNPNLTIVELPDSITTLGEGVFRNNNALTTVNLPNSIVEMGQDNFHTCANLTKVQWSSGLTTIPNYTFYECNSLTSIGYDDTNSIVLPENLTTINMYAFFRCANLEYVDLSKNVISVGDSSFAHSPNLKEVAFGENTTFIDRYAFWDCSSLNKIIVPISTSYGYRCFYDVDTITEIEFLVGTGASPNFGTNNSNSTNHYSHAPWYDQTIETIIIPNNVTSIGTYMFYNSKNISEIKIPNSVTSIGNNSFYNVPHITYNGEATGSPWGAISIN